MPFAREFNDVYDVVRQSVEAAAPGEQLECERLDEVRAAGRITDDLLEGLRRAAICVADVTGNNPNVMWETGYAAALQKPTVVISQDLKVLPFDLKDVRALAYDRSALSVTLRDPLAAAVRATLKRYEVRREEPALPATPKSPLTIAVTGSTKLLPEPTRHRVEKLCEPYVGRAATWLTGSFGTADELVVEYLVSRREQVVIAGYNEFDISGNMLSLVRKHGLPFVDIQREQLPTVERAPSKRDLYMSYRADLVLLLWDGKSSGITELQKWLRLQGKDHIVAFAT